MKSLKCANNEGGVSRTCVPDEDTVKSLNGESVDFGTTDECKILELWFDIAHTWYRREF
jgi:hypothetical protein